MLPVFLDCLFVIEYPSIYSYRYMLFSMEIVL